jgi:tryptophan-rich sensory protein
MIQERNSPKNIPIVLVILVLSLVLGFFFSFIFKLIKTNIKVAVIIIGIVLVSVSMYRLYQLNQEDSDGFLSIGRMMEVFFYGVVGGGLLISTII